MYDKWLVIEGIVIDICCIGRVVVEDWLANIVLLAVASTYERRIFND